MTSSDIENEKENGPGVDIKPVPTFTRENIGTQEVITSFTSKDGETVNITGDVDEAMKIAVNIDDLTYDPKADKKLLRKIDMYLLPLICFLYACQFMDKVSSSYAAVMGFTEAFDMKGDMYSWCGSAFYIGYLFFEFPANLLLQRLPLAKMTSFFIIVWGILMCLHATPTKYPAIITLRTLLGIFESAITPAMVILTGQWYRKEEQFVRTTVWFCCNGIGTIMGGTISYGLATHGKSYSIAAWKILFVIDGLMTIFVGVVFFFHIPDTPAKAWFLNDKEKKMVVLRIKDNQQGFGNKHFKKYQLKEALTDVQTWIFFFSAIAGDIPNGSLTNFGSILLKSDFGYNVEDSLLMNTPGGAVEFVGCIFLALFNKYLPRLVIAEISMIICLMGSCLLSFCTNKSAKLTGYYLFDLSPVYMICSLSCFESNTAGHTKKITCSALYLISYCIGNLVGPQTFIASQAPGYSGGKIAIVVCNVASVFLIAANYFVYWNRNRKRDNENDLQAKAVLSHMDNYQFADMTDKENPYFRYVL